MSKDGRVVIQPIILAAGQGKRIMSEAMAAGLGELPKVMYPLKGKPLVDYPLESLLALESDDRVEWRKPIAVVGFMQELVREHLGDQVDYVEQKEIKGTGSAVKVCAEAVAGDVDGVVVLNGDMPAWRPETIQNMVNHFVEHRPTIELSVVTFTDPTYTADFFAYGRIVRDAQGKIQKIVEQKDATDEERTIQECNPSLYCFARDWLFTALQKVTNNNSQGEYYLTDLLEMAIKAGEPVEALPATDWREALGVNTLDQLKLAEQLLDDAKHDDQSVHAT